MSRQPPGDIPPPQSYSPDRLWFWDGSRWLPVPEGGQPPDSTGPWQRGGIGSRAWAPRPPAAAPRQPSQPPQVPLAAAPAVDVAPPGMSGGRRRRSYLVDIAIVLVALLVLGGIGSGAVIAIRNHQTEVLSSAPRAQAVFEMPYTKRVRSAEFHEVEKVGGSTLSGAGVIDFTPDHAFSESLSGPGGVFERDVEIGGVAYQAITGSKYRATDTELVHLRSLGWDGGPVPGPLEIASQTTLDGRQAWVVKQGNSANQWVIAEQTGDPLEAVLDGNDLYTFSEWGRAPAIPQPGPGQVSTGRYDGSGSTPVVAPAATVTVLKEQLDRTAAGADPSGFRTVALEISYRNTASAPSDFDDTPSLVSAAGVFATAGYTTLSPSLQAGVGVASGQTISGWAGFMVPRHETSFHLLFGEQVDQSQTLDYLISISVQVPG
jgi:hypothetical protein